MHLLDEHIDNTDAELQSVITSITQSLSRITMHAPQPKKHIDPERFKASINQLEEALDDCDTEASDMLTELEQISGGIVFCADRFQNEGGH